MLRAQILQAIPAHLGHSTHVRLQDQTPPQLQGREVRPKLQASGVTRVRYALQVVEQTT